MTRHPFAFLLATALAPASAAVLDVGAGRAFATLQAAVDACPTDGCEIRIHDPVHVLPREAWIEGKRNLSISRSADLAASGRRVRLAHPETFDPFAAAGTAINPSDPQRPSGWRRWPVGCKDSLGGSLDQKNPYSTSGFQHNGMMVVLGSSDVLLEGLLFDGGRVRQFENTYVWDCKTHLLFGNVGLNLFQSRRVTVRECEFRDFFAATYLQGRNPQGALAIYNHLDQGDPTIPKWTRPGLVGDHLVERDLFHANVWAIFDEAEWDMPSTFRWNRAWRNFNRTWDSLDAAHRGVAGEWAYMKGGFMIVRDVARTVHRIHNNILWAMPRIVAGAGWRTGAQHLFQDNLVGGFEDDSIVRMQAQNEYANLLPRWAEWLQGNAFVLAPGAARDTTYTRTWGNVDDSILCTGMYGVPTRTCAVTFDNPVSRTVPVSMPWSGWALPTGSAFTASVDGKIVLTSDPGLVEPLWNGGWIDSSSGYHNPVWVRPGRNRWLRSISLRSFDPTRTDFLMPDTGTKEVRLGLMAQGSNNSGWDSPDIGLPLRGIFTEPWGPDPQRRFEGAGTQCYRVLMAAGRGGIPASARIARIELWSLPWTEMTDIPSKQPARLPLKPMADSSWQEGRWLSFCSDSLPGKGQDHVGSDAIRLDLVLRSGTRLSQMASFVFGGSDVQLPVSTQNAPVTRAGLRIHRVGRGTWVESPHEGSQVRFVSPDGRNLAYGRIQGGRFELPRRKGIGFVEIATPSGRMRSAVVNP